MSYPKKLKNQLDDSQEYFCLGKNYDSRKFFHLVEEAIRNWKPVVYKLHKEMRPFQLRTWLSIRTV